jgi:hypothetical protein
MSKIIASQAIALPITALTCAAAVGAWLGFNSCGSYVWHSYFGYTVLILAALAVLLSSSNLTKRAGLAVLVVAIFLLARSFGFAAYLGASSPGEYLRQFGSTFSSGLC